MKLYRILVGAIIVHWASGIPYAAFVYCVRPSEKVLIYSALSWFGIGAIFWLALIIAMFVRGLHTGRPVDLLELLKRRP